MVDFTNPIGNYLKTGQEKHVGKGKKITHKSTPPALRALEFCIYISGRPVQLSMFDALKSEKNGACSDKSAVAVFDCEVSKEWGKVMDGSTLKIMKTVLKHGELPAGEVDELSEKLMGVLAMGLLNSVSKMSSLATMNPDENVWSSIEKALKTEDSEEFTRLVREAVDEAESLPESKDPRVDAIKSVARSVKFIKKAVEQRMYLENCYQARVQRATAKCVEDEHGVGLKTLPLRAGMSVRGLTLRGKASTYSRKAKTREKALRHEAAWKAVLKRVLTEEVKVESPRGLSSGRDAYFSYRKTEVDWDGEKKGQDRKKGQGGMRNMSKLVKEWNKMTEGQKESWVQEWIVTKTQEAKEKQERRVARARQQAGKVSLTAQTETEMLQELKVLCESEFVKNAHDQHDLYSGNNNKKGYSLRGYQDVFKSGFSISEFVKANAQKMDLDSVREEGGKVCRAVVGMRRVMCLSEAQQEAEIESGKRKTKLDWKSLLTEIGVSEDNLDSVKSQLSQATVLSFSLGNSLSEIGNTTMRWIVTSCSYSPYVFQAIPIFFDSSSNRFMIPKDIHTSLVLDSQVCAHSLAGQAVKIWCGDLQWVGVEIPLKTGAGVGLGVGGGEEVISVDEGIMEVIKVKTERKSAAIGSGGCADVKQDKLKQKTNEQARQMQVDVSERIKKAADFRNFFCVQFHMLILFLEKNPKLLILF